MMRFKEPQLLGLRSCVANTQLVCFFLANFIILFFHFYFSFIPRSSTGCVSLFAPNNRRLAIDSLKLMQFFFKLQC